MVQVALAVTMALAFLAKCSSSPRSSLLPESRRARDRAASPLRMDGSRRHLLAVLCFPLAAALQPIDGYVSVLVDVFPT